MRKYLIPLVLSLFFTSCQKNDSSKTILADPETFNLVMKQLTDVIVHDIFSPPVASRIYAYPSIAAYEAMLPAYSEKYISLSGQLNQFDIPLIKVGTEVDFNLAAIHAFLTTSMALVYSENRLELFQKNLYGNLENRGIPEAVFTESIEYGEQVAAYVLKWANEDMYTHTRTFPKYVVREDEAFWKPTPPEYMEGIEPYWSEIRTMVLDSSSQYPPKEPLEITLKENSEFYKELTEVYEVVKNLDDTQSEIAKFWDCNPYVSHHRGHVMIATKKITPGGHWIGITAIATRKAKSSFDEIIEAYAKTSIALFDAFISCWDEKWRSVVVRPETLINKYLDDKWTPLLQTPPFPEYTSGHSVISRSAAVTLTEIYGDNFAYNDTTEVEYGLKPRAFNSFLEASEEAAISRLYGGIHYMMAITNGVEQGHKIGEHIIRNLKTRKN